MKKTHLWKSRRAMRVVLARRDGEGGDSNSGGGGNGDENLALDMSDEGDGGTTMLPGTTGPGTSSGTGSTSEPSSRNDRCRI